MVSLTLFGSAPFPSWVWASFRFLKRLFLLLAGVSGFGGGDGVGGVGFGDGGLCSAFSSACGICQECIEGDHEVDNCLSLTTVTV